MKTLMIKDLSATEELDSRAMSAVRGGNLPSFWPGYFGPMSSFSFNPQQFISQSQNTLNSSGNNVAFADHNSTVVKPVQNAQNFNTILL
jgi:hypothetical protein